MLTANDYARLHEIVFRSDYPGHKPKVVESPNGDGVKDVGKRYAHVNRLYIEQWEKKDGVKSLVAECTLLEYLEKCHEKALEIAVDLGIPPDFWPSERHSTLRVLEYLPYTGSARHTDFDLFTVPVYRNNPNALELTGGHVFKNHPGVQVGQLYQELYPNIIATGHYVRAKSKYWQYSAVYFAIPDHASELPSGQTVGSWIEEKMKERRYVV